MTLRTGFWLFIAMVLSWVSAPQAEAQFQIKVPKHINRSLDQMKRGANDLGGRISSGSKKAADNLGRGLAEIDQGRIAVMKDKQTMQVLGGVAGGVAGGPQGAAAGAHAAGVFIDGVNGRGGQRHTVERQPYTGPAGGGGSVHPQDFHQTGGLSADDIMRIRKQDHDLRMQEIERLRPIHEEQTRFHRENERRQNDLQKTQTIIRGVLQGVQLLGR